MCYMDGVKQVEHVRMRCTKKTCASLHYYSFRWAGREKLNSVHHVSPVPRRAAVSRLPQ